MMSDKEIEEFIAVRKEAAQHIDPDTAEVEWAYGQILDPYGIDPDLPLECYCVGRLYFARSPESDIWVWFNDLPEAVHDALWEKHKRQLAFPAGLERRAVTATAVPAEYEGDPDINTICAILNREAAKGIDFSDPVAAEAHGRSIEREIEAAIDPNHAYSLAHLEATPALSCGDWYMRAKAKGIIRVVGGASYVMGRDLFASDEGQLLLILMTSAAQIGAVRPTNRSPEATAHATDAHGDA